MSLKIQADAVVKSELEARGIDSTVGVFGSHHVQIGKGKPVRLDVIQSAKVPYAGFKTATQVTRGKAGIHQTAADALKTLAAPGQLNAGKLLGFLKAQQTHLERLDKLGGLTEAQRQDQDGLWMFTKAVENLSNAELSAIYQKFTSAEMDLLQTALIREGQINPEAKDARMAASRLFDLQALVLKEVSNRVSLSVLNDLRAADPNDETLKDDHIALPKKLSVEYGAGEGEAPTSTHGDDITPTNLGILVDVAARSSTERERNGVAEAMKLKQRGLDKVSTKQLGDVLRSAELTINIEPEILLCETGIIEKPDEHLKNIWHLADKGIKPKGEGYLDKRESVEHTIFPEMTKHTRSADERPVYGALNVQGSKLGAAHIYGKAVIVLKEDVKKRTTYTLNDSFFAAKVKITPQRRNDFYRLLDGEPNLPQDLKDVLKNPDSKEHKEMEAWLDRIEADTDVTLNDSFKRNSAPSSIKDHFRGAKNSIDSTEDEQSFLGLCIKCFGDSESTRCLMTTHDNIESLLPQLGDLRGNGLARAAMEQKNGEKPKAVLTDAHYIEAQIQGPLVPKRDIAEIRINIQDFAADQRQAVTAKLKRYQKETGIKVVIQNFDQMAEEDQKTLIEQEQNEFNASHVDQTVLAEKKEQILGHLEESIANFLEEHPTYAPKLDGEPIALTGEILGKVVSEFTESLDSSLAQKEHQFTAAHLVESTFESVVTQICNTKKALMAKMNELDFATPTQKKAFAEMVCNSSDVNTVAEMKLIHKHAKLQANALAELAAAVPPPKPEAVIERLSRMSSALNADFTAYANTLGENATFDFAAKCTELKRISSMALTLLKNTVPPTPPNAIQNLQSMLNSQEMRGFIGQMTAMTMADTLKGQPEMDSVKLVAEALGFMGETISKAVNVEYTQPKNYIGPLSAITQSARTAMRHIAPAVVDALDQAHPAHPPFPQPANPNAMPQSKAQRKEFLIGVLDTYRQKELDEDNERGRSVHGRGHICRAYIFANVFCNIFAEQGVKVDKNAVILGISGHDLGRGGLGTDKWEKTSGDKTNAAIRERYGAEAAGEQYEKEVADSILSVEIKPPNARRRHVPVTATLEGQLLQSADSLDIGRTMDFDDYYFDFLRDKNGNLTPEAQQIRDELIKEADLLQKLTNPYCANRSLIHYLIIEEGEDNNPEITEQKDKLLKSVEKEFIDEAENVSDADFFDNVERVISDHKEMFPLLTKYYIEAE
ncbi:MAG: DUF3626 domain-containing protein [Victivallales bacterium]|nr:DUF3626 domain-containing protein [Victivallales bacterium]